MYSDRIGVYVELLEEFVGSFVSALEFERRYLRLFKNEERVLPESLFRVLDGLFADVDAFCPDSELRDEHDLSEEQLRARCAEALGRLMSWSHENQEPS